MTEDEIDVTANRAARKWTRPEQMGRVAWACVTPLFIFSPRFMWAWRRMLLRAFGAKVGANAHIYPSVRIAIPWNIEIGEHAAIGDRALLYALGPIRVGDRATVSQGAHLCAGTHDLDDPARGLLKPPITIGQDAWICADVFVGPGVTIGKNAIAGARAVVMKDVSPFTTVVGNPARIVQ